MIAHAERALALARELAQPEHIARCLNMIAYAGTISSQWETMAAQAEEARALYAQLGDRLMEADCLALISAGRTHSGRLREGVEAIGLPGELWQLYAELGQPSQAAEIVQSLATAIGDQALRARFLTAASRRL